MLRMMDMAYPPGIIFILDFLCGIPISYYLATISSEPRLTFITVNMLFVIILFLWFQKEMWRTMAMWLLEDEHLSQEVAMLQAARWQVKKEDMARFEIDEIEQQIQRELRAAAE